MPRYEKAAGASRRGRRGLGVLVAWSNLALHGSGGDQAFLCDQGFWRRSGFFVRSGILVVIRDFASDGVFYFRASVGRYVVQAPLGRYAAVCAQRLGRQSR